MWINGQETQMLRDPGAPVFQVRHALLELLPGQLNKLAGLTRFPIGLRFYVREPLPVELHTYR